MTATLLKKGTTVLEFPKPIEPCMDKEAFADHLKNVIETKTTELLKEAEEEAKPLQA